MKTIRILLIFLILPLFVCSEEIEIKTEEEPVAKKEVPKPIEVKEEEEVIPNYITSLLLFELNDSKEEVVKKVSKIYSHFNLSRYRINREKFAKANVERYSINQRSCSCLTRIERGLNYVLLNFSGNKLYSIYLKLHGKGYYDALSKDFSNQLGMDGKPSEKNMFFYKNVEEKSWRYGDQNEYLLQIKKKSFNTVVILENLRIKSKIY